MKNDIIVTHACIKRMIDTCGHEKTLLEICKAAKLSRYYAHIKIKNKVLRQQMNNLQFLYAEAESNHLSGNCVSISTYIFSQLLFEGGSPKLYVGAKVQDNKVNAHMWVEDSGVVFDLLRNKNKYSPLYSITANEIIEKWIEELL